MAISNRSDIRGSREREKERAINCVLGGRKIISKRNIRRSEKPIVRDLMRLLELGN